MARLVLPQFKEAPGGLELETRSLDVEEIDDAFSRVLRAIHAGIDISSLSASARFSVGAPGGAAVSGAWSKTGSRVSLCGTITSAAPGTAAVVLGSVVQSSWIPVRVSGLLVSEYAPEITFYYGASALTAAIAATVASPVTIAKHGLTGLVGGNQYYEFSGTTFLQSPIAAGTVIKATTSRAVFGFSVVTMDFTAVHLS